MKNKIILIGGSGFIGKSFSDYLNLHNIEFLSTNSKNLNLLDDKNILKINDLSQQNSSTFVFFSALTPDKGSDINTFEKNIKMAKMFINNFDDKFIKRHHIIYISSDAVYPFSTKNINSKTTPTPTNLYSSMHLTREIMFKNKFQNQLTILRPTLVYGFGDTHNSYGPNRFFNQMINNEKIDIFGEGNDVRDHLYINDLCILLCHFIKNMMIGTYNLASGNSISYLHLANKYMELFPESLKEIIKIKVNNAVTERYFDISDLLNLFNFYASDLDNNLSKYFKFFNSTR